MDDRQLLTCEFCDRTSRIPCQVTLGQSKMVIERPILGLVVRLILRLPCRFRPPAKLVATSPCCKEDADALIPSQVTDLSNGWGSTPRRLICAAASANVKSVTLVLSRSKCRLERALMLTKVSHFCPRYRWSKLTNWGNFAKPGSFLHRPNVHSN